MLLVDDDAGVRVSVRAMLEEHGHEVVEAAGGDDALGIRFVTGYVEKDACVLGPPWVTGPCRSPFTTHDLAMAVERAIRCPEAAAI